MTLSIVEEIEFRIKATRNPILQALVLHPLVKQIEHSLKAAEMNLTDRRMLRELRKNPALKRARRNWAILITLVNALFALGVAMYLTSLFLVITK